MAERCNGEAIHPEPYSKEAEQVFKYFLPGCRAWLAHMVKTDAKCKSTMVAGDRMRSDHLVWVTLRSGVPEEIFNRDPERWTLDALMSCAERDHWYTFDKTWE